MDFQEKKHQSHLSALKKKTTIRFNFDAESEPNISSIDGEGQANGKKFHNLRRPQTRVSNSNKNNATDRTALRTSEAEDKKLKKTLDSIQQRGATFYKIGFLSHEKKGSRRKLFGEFFNLRNQDIKGTLSTGEIWANKERTNFLRENKIYINNVKLIEKIKNFSHENDNLARKIGSENTVDSSFNALKTLTQIGTIKSFSDEKDSNAQSQPDMKKQHIYRNLMVIRKQLTLLNHQKQRQNSMNILKNLENNQESMGRLEQKYFYKLIQMF